MYCNSGEKATLYYSFNGNKKQISFSDTPIEVTTGSEGSSTGNYSSQGYKITYSEDGSSNLVSRIVKDYQIVPPPPGFTTDSRILFQSCGSDKFDGSEGCVKETLSVDASQMCPNSQPNSGICTISVKHDGAVIFRDTGNCPITYNVSCGDSCPDGYIKCLKQAYPGYCCVECSPIEGRIDALIAEVRNIGHG